MKKLTFATGLILFALTTVQATASDIPKQGERPEHLINLLPAGELKTKLLSCRGQEMTPTKFSIGHRGAPFRYPEHTVQSYRAAAAMGAGIVECDVTFTKDKELVCRHSQNDLHKTTNIVATDLASKCTRPFAPAADGGKATAECRTSDLTLSEFLSLDGKKDGADVKATTAAAYLKQATPTGQLITHQQSIALLKSLNVDFTPELKSPKEQMPFDGMSQQDYAQKMIDAYKEADIDPSRVWPQSFNLKDILYWIENEPEFGKQAVFLDSRYRKGLDIENPDSFTPSMAELKGMGINYLAPPLWMLVTAKEGKIVPSAYAKEAKAAGLKLIAWSLERSGDLSQKQGGWYYQSISELVKDDGATYQLLHVLAQDVGVTAVFSDWPETTTYYANCYGL